MLDAVQQRSGSVTEFSLVIRYVDNPPASAAFYADLLGLAPVEVSATFAMLAFPGGGGLGLWSRHTVTPAAGADGGDGEVAFTSGDVDAVCASWTARGVAVLQAPVDLDFGRTFVALDPDGHRIRVFAPGGGA
jgi:predicted enzyme related to lactoylglutathione lyase